MLDGVVRGGAGATLRDGAVRSVGAVVHGRDGRALAHHQHEADNEHDEPGTHQDVTDEVKVDSVDLEIERERKNRADYEQYNSGSNTHADNFSVCNSARNQLTFRKVMFSQREAV